MSNYHQQVNDDSEVITGEKIPRKKYRERIATCRTCPMMRYTRLIGLTCGKFLHSSDEPGKETCGCKLTIKAWLPFFHCPQKLW